MAKTVRRSKRKRSKHKISKRSKQSKSKSRKNYNKKGGFVIDASKVHPASIILSK